MTVRSSTLASSSGWDRLQSLFDDFRAEQQQTEQFLAETLETLTQAAISAVDDCPPGDPAAVDGRIDQLLAAGEQQRAAVLQALEQNREALRAAEAGAQAHVEQLTATIRQGFAELLTATRERSTAEQSFQTAISAALQQERAATEQALQQAVGQIVEQLAALQTRATEDCRAALSQAIEEQRVTAADAAQNAVADVLEHVVGHALEQQSSLLAKGLEEHRSMVGLAVDALRGACDGGPADAPFVITPETGTEASSATGAVPDSRAAPVGGAVLGSIRAQYQLVQRQNARRRKPTPEPGS
jgi:hypothetical protein